MPTDIETLLSKAALGEASEAELQQLEAAAAQDPALRERLAGLSQAADLAGQAFAPLKTRDEDFAPVEPPGYILHRLEKARERAASGEETRGSGREAAPPISWWQSLFRSPAFGVCMALGLVSILAVPMIMTQLKTGRPVGPAYPPLTKGPDPLPSHGNGPGFSKSYQAAGGFQPAAKATDGTTNGGPKAASADVFYAPRGEVNSMDPLMFLWKPAAEKTVTYDLFLIHESNGWVGKAEGVRPPVKVQELQFVTDKPTGWQAGGKFTWFVLQTGSYDADTPIPAGGEFQLGAEAQALPQMEDDYLLKAAKDAEMAGRPSEALMILLSTSENALPVEEFMQWRKSLEEQIAPSAPPAG